MKNELRKHPTEKIIVKKKESFPLHITRMMCMDALSHLFKLPVIHFCVYLFLPLRRYISDCIETFICSMAASIEVF